MSLAALSSLVSGGDTAGSGHIARARRSATLHLSLLSSLGACSPRPVDGCLSAPTPDAHLPESYLVSLLKPTEPRILLPLLGAIESLARVPVRSGVLLAAGLIPRAWMTWDATRFITRR